MTSFRSKSRKYCNNVSVRSGLRASLHTPSSLFVTLSWTSTTGRAETGQEVTGSEERQNRSTIMTWTCLIRLAEFEPSDTQSSVSSAHKTSAMGQSWCSGRIRCSFTDSDLLLLHRVHFTKNGGGAYYLRFTPLLQSRRYLVKSNSPLWGRSRFLTGRKMASLSTFRHLE